MYHRIVDPTQVDIPLEPGMYVTPEHFRAQMKFLRDNCNVISLKELVSRVKSGITIDAPTVCVTFDDGWRDNYTNAFPSLQEFNIPATIFLATSYIGTTKRFWTDELAYLLKELRSRQQQGLIPDPDQLSPQLRELVNFAGFENPRTNFGELMSLILSGLKAAPINIRNEFFSELAGLGIDKSIIPNERVFVDWQEVSRMSSAGISFGNHTADHLPLATLNESEARSQIELADKTFSQHDIKRSSVFCYPEGSCNDSTHVILEKLGFEAILTTSFESNTSGNLLKLGRTGIHDDISQDTANFLYRLVW